MAETLLNWSCRINRVLFVQLDLSISMIKCLDVYLLAVFFDPALRQDWR